MNIIFPDYAMQCLNTIEDSGYEAWFVGGCVRDSIIGREFFDIDITTNALPDEIEKIFEQTVPTGKKHGTITVIIDKKPIEVTTYRSEFGYDDSRHPNEVRFETDITADLSRRDFTINALAYNPKRNLVDLFGGLKDIENRKIKTVGNANDRFNEDALRILRAFRFASQLGYSIDEDTKKASLLLSGSLQKLSGERVLSELKKLSQGKNPYIIDELLKTEALLPFGIGKLKSKPSSLLDINEEFKAAALIFLCKHNISFIKEKLKADNKLIKQLEVLDEFSKTPTVKSKSDLKLLYNKFPEHASLYLNYIKLVKSDEFESIKLFSDEIFSNNEPYLIKHLKIGGSDLLKLGVKDSQIGQILQKLTLSVIEDPKLNQKELLLKLIN